MTSNKLAYFQFVPAKLEFIDIPILGVRVLNGLVHFLILGGSRFNFKYYFKLCGRAQREFSNADRHSGVFALFSKNINGQIGRPIQNERLIRKIFRGSYIARYADDSTHRLQIAKRRLRLRHRVQKTDLGAFLRFRQCNTVWNFSFVNQFAVFDGDLA